MHAPDRERIWTGSNAARGENCSSKYMLGTRLDLIPNGAIDCTQCTPRPLHTLPRRFLSPLFLVASYFHSSPSSSYPHSSSLSIPAPPRCRRGRVSSSLPTSKDVDLKASIQYAVHSPAQARIREWTPTTRDSTSGTSGRERDSVFRLFTYLRNVHTPVEPGHRCIHPPEVVRTAFNIERVLVRLTCS